jgi:hypothetical protein
MKILDYRSFHFHKWSSEFLYLNQAWAVLRCLVSMIYLDTKKSFPKTENLSRPSIFSLEIYSGTKIFLGLTCDLQTGLTVLGEDLAIS